MNINNMEKKYSYEFMKSTIRNYGCILEEENIGDVLSSIKVRCSCGDIWNTNFSSFKDSKHHCCKKCSAQIGANTRVLDFNYVNNFFESLGYHILDHINFRYDSKMNIIDDEGFKYFVSYNNLKTINKKGRKGLARFGRNNPYSMHNAKKWIDLNEIPLEIIGEKFSVTKKIIVVKCDLCNYIWNTNWDSVFHNHFCPKCKSSTGELATIKILNSKKIDYKFQFYFKYHKDKRKLCFDFYFPKQNVAIEINGRQHYEPVDIFGGTEGFNKQKLHDKIKRDYCKKNNIKLIEIPYWDFYDLESILSETLKV